MSEKPESDEFEDDDDAVGGDGDDANIEGLIRDLDSQKRRGAAKGAEPAWRRLEKYLEQKQTRELLSDFDDYEIDEAADDATPGSRRGRRRG